MDKWDSWDDPDSPKQPAPSPVGVGNIQDYIDDMFEQEMPVRLTVSMTPDGVYYTARIVDVDNPGDVMLDRRGERIMEVTGLNLATVLSRLDAMAAGNSPQE